MREKSSEDSRRSKKGGQRSPSFLNWATGSDEAENSRMG